MKHLLKVLLLAGVSVTATPSLFAASNTTPTEVSVPNDMEKRLEEIKSMDLKHMSRPERRAIKHEVKAMKKKMDSSGGIYISIGAVVLIVILLILLL